MKKYRTWEAIKMITENKGIRFKDECGYEMKYDTLCIRFFENGKNVSWYGINDTEWTLVKETPLDFITAAKSGKRIRIEHKKIDEFNYMYDKEYANLIDIIKELAQNFNPSIIEEILTEGKFYIED